MHHTLTAIVLTKNNQATLAQTLESLSWVDVLIILDDSSIDQTVAIAKKHTPHIHQAQAADFAGKRTEVLKYARSDWIVYVDADEVVAGPLKDEIRETIRQSKVQQHSQLTQDVTAYTVPRRNFFLGKQMYPDRVHRLFYRPALTSWQGQIHETPVFEGQTGALQQPLLHYTHTDISSMLAKTNQWSEIEAELRLEAKHPPVSWWRLLRIAATYFWQQFVQKNVWRFGRAGVFEGYFQIIDKLIVYTKLWEKQNSSAKPD